MRKVFLIGAGRIGIRHLEALKGVKESLDISVIDPIKESLAKAEATFDAAPAKEHKHCISFFQEIPKSKTDVDLAILATTSKDRFTALESLLRLYSVSFILFEKLLFDRKESYEKAQKLLSEKKVKAWVNCTMRTIPFYADMKKDGPLQKINYSVGSGETGLVTSIVHFLDHMTYLTNCLDFTIDTSLLEKKPIEGKRKGFLELLGTIRATFNDCSFGSFTRYPSGTEPSLITITNENVAYIVKETEEKTLVSRKSENWQWNEVSSPIPFQSIMTTWLVDEILEKGICRAVSFEDSVKIHLQILEPLREFLNKNGGKYDYYPFT